MLQIRNNSVLTTPVSFSSSATIIPFDTVDINSNSRLAIVNNKVYMKTIGIYDTELVLNLENTTTSVANATIQLYADDKTVQGATFTIVIPASGKTTIILPWTVKVINAANQTANVSWYATGAGVNLINAIGRVKALM